MKFQFPFKTSYTITQGYADNAGGRYNVHHGALDILPLDKDYKAYPADIFPIANGSEISIQDTDPVHGKGVRERIEITNETDLLSYLEFKGVYKPVQWGKVWLDILYWHMLDVTDKDGILDQNTSIGHCGNTGDVYSGGYAVPNDQKGVPPYPGLHTHLETSIITENFGTLNLDKDASGRFDPMIIFNYKETNNNMNTYVKTINLDGEIAAYIPLSDPSQIELLNKIFNLGITVQADGSIPADIKAHKE